VAPGLVLENANRQRFAKDHGGIAIAAPVYSGVDPMAEADVVRQFVQLAIDGDLARVVTGVGHERETIAGWHKRIGDHKIAVEEELQQGDASARDRTVARR